MTDDDIDVSLPKGVAIKNRDGTVVMKTGGLYPVGTFHFDPMEASDLGVILTRVAIQAELERQGAAVMEGDDGD